MREDEKIALRVTNESKTVIDALEGNARIILFIVVEKTALQQEECGN